MKAPSCPLCGASHWSHEPHDTAGVTVRADVRLVTGSLASKRLANRTVTTVTKQPNRNACPVCRNAIPGKGQYCSPACKQAAYRKRGWG